MARSFQTPSHSLITPGSTEEGGSFEFITNFDRSYVPPGMQRPPFHCGTMASAIQLAWARPAQDLKLFVVYLHKEGNVHTRRFTRIFLSGAVNQLLTHNCILWGWDVTLEANEKTLLRIVSNNLGYDNAWRLQTISKTIYPCFIFLSRTDKKSGIALVQLLRASADLSFTATLFANAIQIFMTKIRPVLILKEERSFSGRQPEVRVRTNQNSTEGHQHFSKPKSPKDKKATKGNASKKVVDDEFVNEGETIQTFADELVEQAPDVSRLFNEVDTLSESYPFHAQDEVAKQRIAELKKQYLEAEYERLKAEKKAIFTRLLHDEFPPKARPGPSSQSDAKQLKLDNNHKDWELRKKAKPPEKTPDHKRLSPKTSPQLSRNRAEDKSDTITIRFRSYKEVFEKRFKADDTFDKLLMFLSSRGYSFTEFKILAGWPRVDISQEDSRTPLRHLNFHLKDNVILAKRKTPFYVV